MLKNLSLVVVIGLISCFVKADSGHSHEHASLPSDMLIGPLIESGGGLTGGNTSGKLITSLHGFLSAPNSKPGAAGSYYLNQGKKELTITIDDGPTPKVTEAVLDVLKKHNLKATFFILGAKVSYQKKVLKRMVDEGHIIGNHSLNHKKLGKVGFFFFSKKIRKEIIDSHKLMEPYMVNSPKWYFRPPYGSWVKKAAKVINKTEYGNNYYGPILWDIGGSLQSSTTGTIKRAADWGCWSKKWTVDQCLSGYIYETEEKKGGVVLFHDLKMESVELIDRYITHYKNNPEYRFVSLEDLNIQNVY